MRNIIVGFIYILVSLVMGGAYYRFLDNEYPVACIIFGVLTPPILWVIGGTILLFK